VLLLSDTKLYTAASIWFEIWRVADPGPKQNRFFQANFPKISIFQAKVSE